MTRTQSRSRPSAARADRSWVAEIDGQTTSCNATGGADADDADDDDGSLSFDDDDGDHRRRCATRCQAMACRVRTSSLNRSRDVM
jgi:hypothetical protein